MQFRDLFRFLGWTWEFGWTGYQGEGKVKMVWKHFTDEEVKGLDPELVSKLDTAREVAGVLFLITSGLRTCDANTAAMGVENSSHLSGKAVDMACADGDQRFKMVTALLQSGFVRIGLYDKHIHVDIDSSKPQNVIWVGVSH